MARWMSRSPSFLRITERMLHEWDHLPSRVQGRPVPPFQANTQDPTIDHGEPHDIPSPFPLSKKAHKPQAKTTERPPRTHASSSDRVAQEIRDLQEKIRRHQ
ncbi:Hypothetical protein MSYG_4426 [Malassezia sympodialis ATCC 42132]|uniref:Uncharacterized protein n=1 Tax=Malassezia sympodialis (strain ATCC 42132) TaxID=1230383 RepID=A0A1M8ACD5_MALS4|nr:Hypothetical protein MSYG_4426 [Malassezia sympodialis ATCC 42132]